MLGRVKQKFGWHSFRLSGILLLVMICLAGAVPAGASPEPEEVSSKAGNTKEARLGLVEGANLDLVLSQMLGTKEARPGPAEGAPSCPADTLPLQIVGRGEWATISKKHDIPLSCLFEIVDSSSDLPLFMITVIEHLAAKLAQENLCPYSAESQEGSLIQFIPWDIHTNFIPLMPQLEASPAGGCRVSSPWIDLVIERGPVPKVRGIVRYSERQLLVDQVVLAGARDVPPGVAVPFTRSEFERYANLEYEPSEILGQPALKPIEERVPPDLLWLFRRSWQERYKEHPFSYHAIASMRRAMKTKTGAEGYTKVVMTLIDRCFTSEGRDLHYNSILDLDDPTLFEQYKIITPIDYKPRNSCF